ncbi:MAG: hypothetical protein U0804_13315 [Gemmataceae bacterium]
MLVLAGLCVLSAAGGAATALLIRPRPTGPVAAVEPVAVTPPARPSGRAPEAVTPPPRPVDPPPPPAADPPPAAPPVPARAGVLAPAVAGRYQVGEAFDQEVTVSRRSVLHVLGSGAPRAAEYAFTSRLTVTAVAPDGTLTVRQRVEVARLVSADPAARGELEAALRAARGATFDLTVGPTGEVTGLKGLADPLRVAEANDPRGDQTFRVWALLDADGWKEMAGLTFFQPDRPLAAGATWTRPLVHSWGPLGSWAGRTRYTAVGPRDGAERVEYAHELTYRPPTAAGGLPFRVLRGDFRVDAAGGVIRYDAARGRVAAAEETFRVRGALAVSVGGVEATAGVEEAQHFRLVILPPGNRQLAGARR